MYAMNAVCEGIEKFCNVSLDTINQHVDARDDSPTEIMQM